ncbi:hypothetical protein SEA_JETAIME_1 [Mycobacterium phage JeTaime]|nr:hypothetical protein SEA_JETAIME_1 [Mycobacterium phage JeTaime]
MSRDVFTNICPTWGNGASALHIYAPRGTPITEYHALPAWKLALTCTHPYAMQQTLLPSDLKCGVCGETVEERFVHGEYIFARKELT